MPKGAKILEQAIKEAKEKNFVGDDILGSGYSCEIVVHRGAAAYICGEETGLIESLEGKRANPRIKPPYFPAALGLYMCPTIVNNVETLCNVKHILEMGAEEYPKLAVPTIRVHAFGVFLAVLSVLAITKLRELRWENWSTIFVGDQRKDGRSKLLSRADRR